MRLNIVLLYAFCVLSFPGFTSKDLQTQQKSYANNRTIKIGLLLQDQNVIAARHAAELAIQKANETGGYKGIPFELVELSMEGPWGTGSKKAVDLIFEKKVVAILGSNDGRNAHLVEQVSAKTRVIFVSSWSGDPTLSQAYVPWYFSCVPNDLQQAEELINEIYFRENIKKIATVSGDDYDSKLSLTSFLKRLKISGKPEPEQFFFDSKEQNFSMLTDQITKAGLNGIILFGQASASVKILEQLRQRKAKFPVFGTLSVTGYNEDEQSAFKSLEGAVLVSSGHWFTSNGQSFRQEFLKKYGYQAGPVAAYAFDGMNLIINAIKNSGTEREDIQKYLKGMKYEGTTGSISFDDNGNRIGKVLLMKIKNGIPEKVP